MSIFGDFIMEARLKNRLSIRGFCKVINEDPSNWSKIERGLMDPPTAKEKLIKIGKALNIKEDSNEFNKLYDLACVSVGQIPDYITDDKELLMQLPAFFRTVENVKPTTDELKELVEALKRK